MLLFDLALHFFPRDAKRRIGKHIIKGFTRQFIRGKGIAKLDIVYRLPLNQHIGFTDGVGLWIDLLPKDNRLGGSIQR